jgi:hypothetical protein
MTKTTEFILLAARKKSALLSCTILQSCQGIVNKTSKILIVYSFSTLVGLSRLLEFAQS